MVAWELQRQLVLTCMLHVALCCCCPAGFCSGYASAIKGSVRLLTGTSVRAAVAVACVAGRLLRGATRFVLRVRV